MEATLPIPRGSVSVAPGVGRSARCVRHAVCTLAPRWQRKRQFRPSINRQRPPDRLVRERSLPRPFLVHRHGQRSGGTPVCPLTGDRRCRLVGAGQKALSLCGLFGELWWHQ
jgi:hypothetical protein